MRVSWSIHIAHLFIPPQGKMADYGNITHLRANDSKLLIEERDQLLCEFKKR